MSEIRAIVVSPEEAYDGTAELWCAAALHMLIDGPHRSGE